MSELKLQRHGETIKPVYAPTSRGVSWAGSSTNFERPDGEISGIVKRYNKHEEASNTVTAIGLIKGNYTDAIEYTGIAAHARGLIIFFGVCGASVSVGLGLMYLTDILAEGLQRTFNQVLAFFASTFILAGIYFLLSAIRIELFRPEDEPIIFDRKHRKVYRLFREVHPGLVGLFKRWPLQAVEYDWDLIDAEHNAALTNTGSSVIRYHSLIFLARKSANDPTIIDSFPVGNTVQLGELSVAPVWEHIRRFMEDNGPHLPPGELLNIDKPPRTLWQSYVQVAPLGPSYASTWKQLPLLMVFHHLLFPISIPIFFFWGIFNWLSYKTATPIKWPQEVLDAVDKGRN